ncbi:MAG: hypothetical protein P857_382 [Candidatus Xenolissoclinum pacificiensis L6]|uniref:FAD-binding FR-type domain-containing protein n=1 Tax=Candidatus Xenolissoclinum pacificiensis L6 TaxID=1401685 RepID=W2V1C5_9RICK|nr:MAG: hypothetical protein P857_382 [Candidatus Xenolissoclinum pacificiensis L6]
MYDIQYFVVLKGVRLASEFLMALHLYGAFQEGSIYNLQIRFPVCVLGAGLTAVDVATEILAYYPIQVRKVYKRFQELTKIYGQEYIYQGLTDEDRYILEEYLYHAELFENSTYDEIVSYLQSIGGVQIIYYRDIQHCSAYKLNYSELQNALDQGVQFLEHHIIKNVVGDEYNALRCINVTNCSNNKNYSIQAKSLLISIGTMKNDRIDLVSLKDYSIWGDISEQYAGSVVKAMASVKRGYHQIVNDITSSEESSSDFLSNIDEVFTATITRIENISDSIIQIQVHAPMMAKLYKPGQFFRLQNFYQHAININDTKMVIEPLAVTGAHVDNTTGLITFIILDSGASSYLCKFFQVGEQLSLMGPVGNPTEIVAKKNIMLIGGGVGNAVLFSIIKSMYNADCNITYCAGYKNTSDRFHQNFIEQYTHRVLWACDEGILDKNREQDISYHGSVLDGMEAHFKDLSLIYDKVFICGSYGLMSSFRDRLYNNLKGFFHEKCQFISSINAPMQCMMGGVCGACIQKDNNNIFFSCGSQEKCLLSLDLEYLKNRLEQNSLQEKLTYKWVKHCMLNYIP